MEHSGITNNQKSELKIKCNLDNIKNDYFLQKVFNNLSKKETFEIMKYNKKIKERLNININDYKEYCEKYSSIEIELTPIKINMENLLILMKEMNYIIIYILIIIKKKK